MNAHTLTGGQRWRDRHPIVRYLLWVFAGVLLAGYYLSVGFALVGELLVRSRSLPLYAVLIILSFFFPLLGIVLAACVVMYYNRPIWDRGNPVDRLW